MARFTIRVVLHDNPSLQDFLLLDQRLAALNITDDIQADTGQWYRLPPGEYYCYGDVTGEHIRNEVARVAATIKPRFEVFVTEGGNRFWQGLQQIAAPR